MTTVCLRGCQVILKYYQIKTSAVGSCNHKPRLCHGSPSPCNSLRLSWLRASWPTDMKFISVKLKSRPNHNTLTVTIQGKGLVSKIILTLFSKACSGSAKTAFSDERFVLFESKQPCKRHCHVDCHWSVWGVEKSAIYTQKIIYRLCLKFLRW